MTTPLEREEMPEHLGLVLEELRGMRAELTDMRVKQETRLTALELHDKECYGNGQPGWRQTFDNRLKRIETKILLITGGALAIGAIGHLMIDIWKKF